MPVPDRLAAALADRYRIERELGAGGMATVFLAQDLKHDRKVAVKVLKPELAAVLGAERFVVEIKTTAALQHPHILPLFDSGTADGFLFYVMPFIQGETLRDKLSHETQLGVDEAVRITAEIADALHYAHSQGVIHRDIKPENILLANGRPMVADFGIALAVSAAAGGRMTETGLSLGTPHYMSPEQATAEKEITGRSDIYSLASVCYEMLTGNPPHVGSSAQQIIMKIITEQPQPVSAHRKSVPPHVAAAVAKALEKLPADRFESAAKFAEALSNPSFTTMATGLAPAAGVRGASRNALLAVSAVAVVATAVAAWLALRPLPDQPVLRYRLAVADSAMPVPGAYAPLLAPDGSFLIFRGPVPGELTATQLWIKRRDSHDATPIAGTRDAGAASISPDGRRIAFDYGGTLRTVTVDGTEPSTLVQRLALLFGTTWLDNDRIAYTATSPRNTNFVDIAVIPAAGGTPTFLGLDAAERAAVVPQAIHGRDAMLYALCFSPVICDLHVYDFRDSTSKQLVSGSTLGVYAPSGHLLFERGGALMGVRFDVDALEIRGDPVQLLERNIDVNTPRTFSIARDGTLSEVLGSDDAGFAAQQLVWVDRTGRQELVDSAMSPLRMIVAGANHGWSLSPDGRRLAIGLQTAAGDNVWVKQLPRGALTRISFDQIGSAFRPKWTPDGRSVVYLSPADVRIRRADGAGRDSVMMVWQANEVLFAPDGKTMILRAGAAGSVTGGRNLYVMRIGEDSLPRPLLAAPNFDETSPALSPDGRWLLYQSDESGRNEIYLRPFPDVDRVRVQVSVSGGVAPLWARNGREIFFLSADWRMMAASFTAAATPTIGAPRVLFDVPADLLGVERAFSTPWDVAADGRFLMTRLVESESSRRAAIVLTHNFFTELRAKLPR